jgi:hypothetical protein
VRGPDRGEYDAEARVVQRAGDGGEPAQRGRREAAVPAEHRADRDVQAGQPGRGLGDRARHVDARVEGVPEQQRHDHGSAVPVGGHRVEDVGQPGRGQVQEGQSHVQPGPLPAHLVDQRGHRGGRARVAAAVCDGDEC